jgi:hypothetical protein
MQIVAKIVPCLWFDHQGKEAAALRRAYEGK